MSILVSYIFLLLHLCSVQNLSGGYLESLLGHLYKSLVAPFL